MALIDTIQQSDLIGLSDADTLIALDVVVQIGATTGPRWSIPSNGIPSQPTTAQITTARAKIVTNNTNFAAAAWWDNICDGQNGVSQLLCSGLGTINGIKSIVANG